MLTRAELHDELAKLSRAMEPAEIDALVGMDVLPVRSVDAAGYPTFALTLLVDALAIRGAGDLDEVRRRAAAFRAAYEGETAGLERAHRELRRALAERAVLGELHRMLPVMEWVALETLRGDARLEWRIRQAIQEITALTASDRYRDESFTPVYGGADLGPSRPTPSPPHVPPAAPARPGTARTTSGVQRVTDEHRLEPPPLQPVLDEPRSAQNTRLGGIPAAADSDEAPPDVPRVAAEPYALGPEDRHPPGYRRERPSRMPVLRPPEAAPAPAPSPSPPPITAEPPMLFEDTETFVGRSLVEPIPAASLDGTDFDLDGDPVTTSREAVRGPVDVTEEHPSAERASANGSAAFRALHERAGEARPAAPRPASALEHARMAAMARGREPRHPTRAAHPVPMPDESGPGVGSDEAGAGGAQAVGERDAGDTSRRTAASPVAAEPASATELPAEPERVTSMWHLPEPVLPTSGHLEHPRSTSPGASGGYASPPLDDLGGSLAQLGPPDPVSAFGGVSSGSATRLERPPLASNPLRNVETSEDRRRSEAMTPEVPLRPGRSVPESPAHPGPAAGFAGDEETQRIASEPAQELRPGAPAPRSSGSASESSEGSARRDTGHRVTGRGDTVARFARHTDLLVDPDGLGGAPTLRSPPIELANRRAPTPASVDIGSLARDPATAIARSEARLRVDPRDRGAQDELLALLGTSDPEVARSAFAVVEPALRSDPGRAEALFGALVVMAGRHADSAERVRCLVDAGTLATHVLGDDRQGFELFVEAMKLAPEEPAVVRHASEHAERRGWWAEFVAAAEVGAAEATRSSRKVALCRLAARAAREHLGDDQRCIAIYEALLDSGVYDEDAVAALVDIYTTHGRAGDTLVMLLKCADLVDGPEKVERITHAADLCVEELNDPERALAIYEQALDANAMPGVVSRYVALAVRSSRQRRALAYLAPDDGRFESRMERARVAREVFEDDELERVALAEAFDAPDADFVPVGLALADAYRRCGDHGAESRTLEAVLEAVPRGSDRVNVIRRLAAVYVADETRTGGTERAIALYNDALESGVFDDKLIHALVSLLRASGQTDRVVDVLRTAARRAGGAHAVPYLRQLTRVVNDAVADDGIALDLLEEAADASGRDADVLLQLAARCRRVGDDLSEMAALEQAVEQEEGATAPTVLARLAELELSRPRGAARAVELVHQVLDLDPLPEELEAQLATLMPVLVDKAQDFVLELRWVERAARRARTPREAVPLLLRVVELQELVGTEGDYRVRTTESALGTANEAGASAEVRAELQLAAARAKMSVGHWNSAVQHASDCARAFLRVAPGASRCFEATALVAELAELVIDERPALEVLQEAAATGLPAHRAALGRALVKLERWNEAITVLENLIDQVDPRSGLSERLASDLEVARSNVGGG